MVLKYSDDTKVGWKMLKKCEDKMVTAGASVDEISPYATVVQITADLGSGRCYGSLTIR